MDGYMERRQAESSERKRKAFEWEVFEGKLFKAD